MRVLFAVALVLSLGGCAVPYATQSGTSGSYASAATYRATLERTRADRDARKRQLSESKLQDEIDRLTKEIRELELRVSELEWQVEDAERRESAAALSSPSSSGCYTGPRGGRYTISKSGKKNYRGC